MEENKVVQRICEELEKQGKKQTELTTFLGISPNAVTDWKSGRIKSYMKHLPKIAEFLGVSVESLTGQKDVTNSEDAELAEFLEELKTRPEMKMLFSVTKGATKTDVEKAVNIIKALRESENG